MRALISIAAAALLTSLAACGSDEPETPVGPPRAEPPCHAQLKSRIDLAGDGSVVRADARPELGYDDPCRGAQDAALRAIWAASPLNVPRNREWDSLTLIFDRDALM